MPTETKPLYSLTELDDNRLMLSRYNAPYDRDIYMNSYPNGYVPLVYINKDNLPELQKIVLEYLVKEANKSN